MNYILEGKTPKKVDDIVEWAKWMNLDTRIIKTTYIDNIKISTIFLGIDHAWDGGPPILFETMIFGGDKDQYQERYYTYESALIGHKKVCDMVKKGSKKLNIIEKIFKKLGIWE